ncbi:hypothetical protein BDB00DRAFT_391020 [Zychaea mexicana]|uniref:uncharacterized protein n=1 Tax=Zychaea mexicana TaxID=64656 RepID=UPI0022FDF69E|nr:uncharacterized protein BDB00DRAFT_391020 [Zychaea mexicana]KAI9498563.1 hypothetical protein BDB00DRAFT_391020 [Zychaea mexicana]
MIPPLHQDISSHGYDRSPRGRYINLLALGSLLLFVTTTFLFCFDQDGFQCFCSPFSSDQPPANPPPPNKDIDMPNNCPNNFADYAETFHDPGSGGPLNLPFQRPVEACRRFTSSVVNTAVESLASKIADLDLARLFTNTYPNTLDTTIESTQCINTTDCNPLSFVITGDIHAMWLRDSANQLLPYLDYVNKDLSLKRLFLGLIHMQASLIKVDPYANAFNAPKSMATTGTEYGHVDRAFSNEAVFERKWEVDSLASFLGFSYQYWNVTGDSSFVQTTDWMDAVETIIKTIHEQQEPTFNEETGYPMDSYYKFKQNTERPTETQFLSGIGQPVKRTGLVKSLFRPSDDATVYPFFIPGNAMISVELAHVAQLVQQNNAANNDRLAQMATEMTRLSKEIRDAIYTYAVTDIPGYDKVFAYEVDGYGSKLIMDDANVPSLLSLSMLGFVSADDPVYQSTRKLVLSRDNPYYFSGPRAGGLSGIGGPHVGLNYAWPMSQIVRILTSTNDTEIVEALGIILRSTDGTGLIHESVNVHDDGKNKYTRPWFAWVNGLFGQAILKLAKERPHLLFDRRYN